MRKNKVDIITLGCSKNLVDSEQLMRLGAHAKFDYRAAVGHKLSLYGGYMDLRSAQVRDAVNPEWETTRLRWNRQYIFSTVLSGEHSFLDNRALTFDWSATASKAFNQTPDNAEIGLTTAVNGAQTVTPNFSTSALARVM